MIRFFGLFLGQVPCTIGRKSRHGRSAIEINEGDIMNGGEINGEGK